MCSPIKITELRSKAYDILRNNYCFPDFTGDKIKAPIWCFNYDNGFSYRKNISKAFKDNCLPVSMAVYHIMSTTNKRIKCRYRVVIGKVVPYSSEESLADSLLEDIFDISKIEDIGWHSWVEVSSNNFRSFKIIDLTYASSQKIKNFDKIISKKKRLKHVSLLTDGASIEKFYKNLLIKKNLSTVTINAIMDVAKNYIQKDDIDNEIKNFRKSCAFKILIRKILPNS